MRTPGGNASVSDMSYCQVSVWAHVMDIRACKYSTFAQVPNTPEPRGLIFRSSDPLRSVHELSCLFFSRIQWFKTLKHSIKP